MRGLWIVGVAALLVGCATKATKGLLDDAPFETLTEAGDLGFDRLVFPARDIALPSGLRVAYETTPSRGMVAVVLAIDVGSTSDPEGREGLAHYAEHLVFRNRPRAIELAFELARLGATYNASTTLDATTFHVIAPANSLPALIDLVADVLQRPLQTVDPGDANVELEVVRNELLFRNESGVYGQLRGWMQSLLIEPSHPYRRPVGGTAESVGRLTLQDAKSFAETHYKPAKATLLVAGDIKGERLDQLVKERFPPSLLGDPNHPVVRDVGPVPLLNVTLPGTPPSPPRHQAAVPLPEVWIGYLMPGKFSQNAGNTRLVTSGATEERLRELLNDDRDVLAVNLVPLHDRLATILAIQVVLASDGRREEIALRVRDVMGMMWQPLHPKMAELFAAATPSTPVRVSGGYVMVRPTAAYYAQMRAEQLLRQRFKGITDTLHGLEPWIDRALERAEYLQVMGKPGALMWANHQVALSQERLVGNFSQQFLAPERARFAYVDPLPAERQPRAGRTGVADRPIADERTATVVYEQPFLAPAPDELSKMHAVRLENGLQVVVVNRPTFPSVAAVLGFAGGAVVGQPPGVVELVQRLESLAGIGLPLNGIEATPIDGPSFTGDLVRAGARNLPNALFLLAQRIVDTDRTEWSALLDRKD
ncbi:MAG TPA: pitrilysin family protein, partial [Polyangia bacterium]